MKIYFLINSLTGGGAEKMAINLARVLSPEKIFLLERDVQYSVENLNLQFLSSHSKKTNSVLKTFYIPFYAKKLSRYLKPGDIVISFLERANYVNIFSSLFKKHKTIISVHMSQISGRKKFHPYNFLTKFFYPKADLIVAVSQGIKRELVKHFKINEEKIKIIYNFVDIKEISEKANEPIDDFLKPFIVCVGRLTKPKGQWYLLRIFRELKKEFERLKLLILGDGELKDYLVFLSKELGLKTYVWEKDELRDGFDVYFLGFQKNPFKYISKAEAAVFPSLWEGFLIAIVEALACGVFVISSDCQAGPREILAPMSDFNFKTEKLEFGEYGVLMPVFEPKYKKAKEPLTEKEKIWIEALKRVLKNENLKRKYSEKSKERAKDFSVEKILPQWEEILRKLRS